MAPRQPPLQTMNEICLVMDAMAEKLESRSKTYDQRGIVDDARNADAVRDREDLIRMITAQGNRLVHLEAQWVAFFSAEGAFPLIVKESEGHGKKIDRLMWLAAVGFGILIALQFVMGRIK